MTDEYIQGSTAWLELRKTKITATDACAIMGVNPYKNRDYLMDEKLSNELPLPPTARMQRGIDLEPSARDLFSIKTGIQVNPKVIVKGWTMASLDGISSDGTCVLEIKCPGDKDHEVAVSGNVPDHYYPQLQHQMYVCEVEEMYYFSFDGFDGVLLNVKRDDDYIVKMLDAEWMFYQDMQKQRGIKL